MPTLLIADDSPHKIMLMEGMLLRHGWTGDVLIASTSQAAMGLIDAHPDILFALIDYYIPPDNGPAIITYLKNTRPHARIALVSSSDRFENLDAAKAAGAEACICTSYEADEVERAFEELLTSWLEEQE